MTVGVDLTAVARPLRLPLGSNVAVRLEVRDAAGAPVDLTAADLTLDVLARATRTVEISFDRDDTDDADGIVVFAATATDIASIAATTLTWRLRDTATGRDWIIGPATVTATGQTSPATTTIPVTVGPSTMAITLTAVTPGGGAHVDLIAGDGIIVDSTDPTAPLVSVDWDDVATANQGAAADTALQPEDLVAGANVTITASGATRTISAEPGFIIVDTEADIPPGTPAGTVVVIAHPPSGVFGIVAMSAFGAKLSGEVTITKPDGIETGDVLVAALGSQVSTNPITAPTLAGWTPLAGAHTIGSDGRMLSLQQMTVADPSSLPATWTWDYLSADPAYTGARNYGLVMVIRGADPVAPLTDITGVISATAEAGGTMASPKTGPLAVTHDGSQVVIIATAQAGSGNDPALSVPPDGWTVEAAYDTRAVIAGSLSAMNVFSIAGDTPSVPGTAWTWTGPSMSGAGYRAFVINPG